MAGHRIPDKPGESESELSVSAEILGAVSLLSLPGQGNDLSIEIDKVKAQPIAKDLAIQFSERVLRKHPSATR